MVVPVSLDPGYNDPRSPYFSGCHKCGNSRAKSSPCRDCQARLQREEARAKQARQEALSHKLAQALEESGELDEELREDVREELPREVAIEEEHRAERAWQKLQGDADE